MGSGVALDGIMAVGINLCILTVDAKDCCAAGLVRCGNTDSGKRLIICWHLVLFLWVMNSVGCSIGTFGHVAASKSSGQVRCLAGVMSTSISEATHG